MLGLLGGDVDEWIRSTMLGAVLDELSERFGCCQPAMCPDLPAGEACTLRAVPNVWEGGYWATWTGGLSHAAHLAVTLMTEEQNNSTVFGGVGRAPPPPPHDGGGGGGGGGAATAACRRQTTAGMSVGQLFEVANRFFDTYRSPMNALAFGQDLSATLLYELARAARVPGLGRATPALARAAAGRPVQWYVGHDVNVAFVARLIGLTTSPRGYPFESLASVFLAPLVVELVPGDGVDGDGGGGGEARHRGGAASATVRAWMGPVPPDRMRALDLGAWEPVPLSIGACSAPLACPLAEFVQLVASRLTRRECMDGELGEAVDRAVRWAGEAASSTPSLE